MKFIKDIPATTEAPAEGPVAPPEDAVEKGDGPAPNERGATSSKLTNGKFT